ncbi:MAG: hypothetical protein IPP58_15580 [Holophagaceae bacterium]|uniref:Uncharacterized protein n=1 Tax=Candidatus Geothrix skivensis TaxID=2954439 RepID=A0A9D7XJN4_9BACT|nr:hypothetical protein [Candidatus Geothrix skivensis]
MSFRRLVLALILTWAGGHLSAQADPEPVLYVQAKEGGQDGSNMSWSCTGQAEYRLCTHWDGPRHGMAAKDVFRLRRSVLGLKPGERLQFYLFSMSAESTGNESGQITHASTKSLGAGSYVNTLGNTRWHDIYPPHFTPPSAEADAELIRTAKGARLVLKGIPCPHVGDAPFHVLGIDNLKITEAEKARLYTVELSEAELASWGQLTKTLDRTFQAKPEFGGFVSYSATVTTTLPDLGDVDVEVAGYENWIPLGNLEDEAKPGNTVKVTARLRATGESGRKVDTQAEFTFELTDISQEPGVCLNWPTKPDLGKGDLRLRQAENAGLEVVTEDRKLRTKGLVQEATLVVSAFDYAAWGVLKITAKDKDGKELKVTYHKQELSSIQLPKDEDRNRIADAWQAEKGVPGFPASWDEAEVAGQTQKGDGLTLFQKYRGLVVLGAGGRSYLRPEPRQKVHFVIDPDGLVDLGRLQMATGLHPFRVQEVWTKDRKVDIHAGFASGGGKFASLITKDLSVVKEHEVPSDPTGKKTHTQMVNDLRSQWAKSEAPLGEPWTPRTVDGIVVFSGRIHDRLRRIRDRMLDELRHPEKPDNAEGLAWMGELGMGAEEKEQARNRLEALTDQELWALVKPIEQWLAIHELCHGVGVNGHLKGKDEDEECVNRVPACPMQYLTWQEKRRYLLFGELGGNGKLCSQAPHSCWKQVSPKN